MKFFFEVVVLVGTGILQEKEQQTKKNYGSNYFVYVFFTQQLVNLTRAGRVAMVETV